MDALVTDTTSAGGRNVVVIAGPSGSGKGTVIARLQKYFQLPIWLSVSVTTRQPRPSETDGVEYYFRSQEDFDRMARQHMFLEHKLPHGGSSYGTPIAPLNRAIEAGHLVVIEVNVEGVVEVQKRMPLACCIFLYASDENEQLRRLINRGDQMGDIQTRLVTTSRELEAMHDIFPPENILQSIVLGTEGEAEIRGMDATTELVVSRIKAHAAACWNEKL